MPSLTRQEARERAELLSDLTMQVSLDLTIGAEQFASRTTITFTCTHPGADTFLDLKAAEVHEIVVNGHRIDPSVVIDERLPLTGLAERNTVEVDATMSYSRDGQGLHRTVDPADGQHYVFGHLFLDAAPKVFACFDQPDLKAPYTLTVAAPGDWVVIGNGAATAGPGGRWELASTQPLATYFVTICAGPYARVTGEHDGIPLGVYARASLKDELEAQAGEILDVTRACFDHYHDVFGIRYPFGKYDQVFVPEFNAGAMENPGCVTFRDEYVFRGAATAEQHLTRANTIAHEMAHMWFGDLVTMRWWDDLWLNESFAEYLSYRALTQATGWSEAWVEFSIVRKVWGYAAERAPSTHPVAGSPAPDALAALQNFDGISYAKGASVLRQLVAHIGREAFDAGVRAHLEAHSLGNASLADFLAALEAASGQDLGAWSQAWLETAGADRISTQLGGLVRRSTPEQYPADRPHRLDVAGFTAGAQTFRVPLEITAEVTTSQELAQAPSANIVVPNAADLTWADVELSEHTIGHLAGELSLVPDPLARAVTWGALLSGVYRGEVDPRTFLDVLTGAWPTETNDAILARVAAHATDRIIPTFLPPQAWESATARVAGAALVALHAAGRNAATGPGRVVALARVVAVTTSDFDRLSAWLEGRGLPVPVEKDADFRWLVATNLAARGCLDVLAIERLRAADDTLTGHQAALQARASIPDPAAKGWAWTELTTNRERSNRDLLALARGMWVAPDLELVCPYVTLFPEAVSAMSGWLGDDALERVASLAFPGRVVEQATSDMAAGMLERDDLTPGVRRAVLDADHELREALRSREAFG